MAELIPIGKMASANRVTIATLRLYDQMGLLKPAYTDPDSGYRYYDIRQTSRLDFIRYMRDLGLSLADIQSILEKEDIPLIARMICVADSFDAMNTNRVYRNKLSKERIIEEIETNKGRQFDPEIAEVFLRILRENRLPTES